MTAFSRASCADSLAICALVRAINTPTYSYAYHDATVDGLTRLTKLMGIADSGGTVGAAQ